MTGIDTIDHISYIPGAQAILALMPTDDLFEEPKSTLTIGKDRIVPWGYENDLPQKIMRHIGKSEVVSSNLHFNIRMAYGQGLAPMMRVRVGSKTMLEPCEDERILDFFENNDISGYFLEQCTDMCTFGNVFPEIILNKGLSEIVSLRHKEAVFSRWNKADESTGEIYRHHYSAKWGDGANEDNTVATAVLSRHNPAQDLITRVEERKITVPRFIIPISFPTPGKVYYQRPSWWTIFRSGSFDFSTLIWEYKKMLLKNGLRVRYIIYVSDKYWEAIFTEEKVDKNNPEAVKKRKEAEIQKFRDFLSSDKNHGNGLMALKKMIASGTSAVEEKYITIETLKIDAKGGEYLDDSSEVSSMMSYAMDVHPNLIGSAPGKSGGSMSGTDKRELFMIKSALMKPFRDRLLKPLYVIKRFNKWPRELEFVVPDFEFTTLADDKSGKKEVVQDPAKTEEK